jgi:hypothetical protein
MIIKSEFIFAKFKQHLIFRTFNITTCFILSLIFCLLFSDTLWAEWVDADGTGQESINIYALAQDSYVPILRLDTSGNPHIAWIYMLPGVFYHIYYLYWNGSAWVDADGTGQESIRVPSSFGYTVTNPSLSLDTSGNPYIAWSEGTLLDYDICYLYWNGSAWVDADGTGQESKKIFNDASWASDPSLYLDTLGNPHIVWSNSGEIYYLYWNGSAWVDADGTGQESINISNNGGASSTPSLFLDTSSNPHITWSDNTPGNYDIYYLKWNGSAWVDADGTGQESINISNNGGASQSPSVYLDTSGNLYIAWSDNTAGNYDIYYLKWNGSAWVDADGTGQESINISNNGGASQDPSVYLDTSVNLYIAWSDNTPGNYDIYYLEWNGSAWVDADGTGQESINISNNGGASSTPSLSLDTSGNPYIAWSDNTPGNYEIYYLYWSTSTTLSISIDSSSYDFGSVFEASTNVATSSITVTNNGNVAERYSLQLSAPAGWTAVTDTAPGAEEFRFCGNFQTATAQSSHFVIGVSSSDAIGTAMRVSSNADFGKDNEGEAAKGYNVPVSEERYLWFRFEAPTSTVLTSQQTITVTITAEEQP